MKADIGMIGLAVMGSNLALNMIEKGFTVAVYNLEPEAIDAFMKGEGGAQAIPCYDLETLVASLSKPRVVMMMIRAGAPVDETIGKLLPLLSPGDIIIDGGNSHFPDTDRRCKRTLSEWVYPVAKKERDMARA